MPFESGIDKVFPVRLYSSPKCTSNSSGAIFRLSHPQIDTGQNVSQDSRRWFCQLCFPKFNIRPKVASSSKAARHTGSSQVPIELAHLATPTPTPSECIRRSPPGAIICDMPHIHFGAISAGTSCFNDHAQEQAEEQLQDIGRRRALSTPHPRTSVLLTKEGECLIADPRTPDTFVPYRGRAHTLDDIAFSTSRGQNGEREVIAETNGQQSIGYLPIIPTTPLSSNGDHLRCVSGKTLINDIIDNGFRNRAGLNSMYRVPNDPNATSYLSVRGMTVDELYGLDSAAAMSAPGSPELYGHDSEFHLAQTSSLHSRIASNESFKTAVSVVRDNTTFPQITNGSRNNGFLHDATGGIQDVNSIRNGTPPSIGRRFVPGRSSSMKLNKGFINTNSKVYTYVSGALQHTDDLENYPFLEPTIVTPARGLAGPDGQVEARNFVNTNFPPPSPSTTPATYRSAQETIGEQDIRTRNSHIPVSIHCDPTNHAVEDNFYTQHQASYRRKMPSLATASRYPSTPTLSLPHYLTAIEEASDSSTRTPYTQGRETILNRRPTPHPLLNRGSELTISSPGPTPPPDRPERPTSSSSLVRDDRGDDGIGHEFLLGRALASTVERVRPGAMKMKSVRRMKGISIAGLRSETDSQNSDVRNSDEVSKAKLKLKPYVEDCCEFIAIDNRKAVETRTATNGIQKLGQTREEDKFMSGACPPPSTTPSNASSPAHSPTPSFYTPFPSPFRTRSPKVNHPTACSLQYQQQVDTYTLDIPGDLRARPTNRSTAFKEHLSFEGLPRPRDTAVAQQTLAPRLPGPSRPRHISFVDGLRSHPVRRADSLGDRNAYGVCVRVEEVSDEDGDEGGNENEDGGQGPPRARTFCTVMKGWVGKLRVARGRHGRRRHGDVAELARV
ncbi:hypothetical protein CC78DRAFT_174553 [Lojkania enalia]|uniref:Uncharacterized protein n=1 Tax=Lojkania enalia TaxID=147567 RepID=A0A9P4N8P0_9PLEO|nr:hypothetical protein CC78DRAFT_174553 [Didymosphaeria enalia]